MTFKVLGVAIATLVALFLGAWLMLAPGHGIGEILFGGILVVLNFYNLVMIGRSLAGEDWHFPWRRGRR